MKKTIIRIIAVVIAAVMLPTFTACGGKNDKWTRKGYFSDENNHMLSVTYMELDDESGWYVGLMIGEDLMEDSYGGMVEEKNGVLSGTISSSGSKADINVTVSEEGKNGLKVEIKDGKTYHFTPSDMPNATIIVTVNVDGFGGNISYAVGSKTPEFDPDYPYQSAQINLAEPTEYTIAASPNEGYKFVKWTKNGEDYSTDIMFTTTLDESADFVAFFEESTGN
ncbi:MAG: hypothetical protein IJM51_00570 [Clostridia bacterium]|nr:hypothetical protein [Clostridia bacterium]